MIICGLSCKKSDNEAQQEPPSATATNLICKTVYSSPSVPNIYWTVTVSVPDTNAVVKLTLRAAGTLTTAFAIDKPKTKTYTQLIQPGRACPNDYAQAYYFFEWLMADGTKRNEAPFQVIGN